MRIYLQVQLCMGGSHEISLPHGGPHYTVVTSHGPKLPAGIKKIKDVQHLSRGNPLF